MMKAPPQSEVEAEAEAPIGEWTDVGTIKTSTVSGRGRSRSTSTCKENTMNMNNCPHQSYRKLLKMKSKAHSGLDSLIPLHRNESWCKGRE